MGFARFAPSSSWLYREIFSSFLRAIGESPLFRFGIFVEFQSGGLRMRLRAGVSGAIISVSISIRPWHFSVKRTKSVQLGFTCGTFPRERPRFNTEGTKSTEKEEPVLRFSLRPLCS